MFCPFCKRSNAYESGASYESRTLWKCLNAYNGLTDSRVETLQFTKEGVILASMGQVLMLDIKSRRTRGGSGFRLLMAFLYTDLQVPTIRHRSRFLRHRWKALSAVASASVGFPITSNLYTLQRIAQWEVYVSAEMAVRGKETRASHNGVGLPFRDFHCW